MELEGECPVCGESFSLEIDDPDAGSLEYDCECGASLVISYSVTVEVDDVEVSGGATAEFECPRDGSTGSLEISDEDGEEEVECDSCEATLSVTWSDWGAQVEVTVLDEPNGDDDEDQDEDDDSEDDEDDEDDDDF